MEIRICRFKPSLRRRCPRSLIAAAFPRFAAGRSRAAQFANSHEELSPDAKELALAIDGYKLRHRRRFITYEEMLTVIKGLGYQREG